MIFRPKCSLQDWFRNKLGVGPSLYSRIRVRVRVRVGVWNRVSVSEIVALLRFVTQRPAK